MLSVIGTRAGGRDASRVQWKVEGRPNQPPCQVECLARLHHLADQPGLLFRCPLERAIAEFLEQDRLLSFLEQDRLLCLRTYLSRALPQTFGILPVMEADEIDMWRGVMAVV